MIPKFRAFYNGNMFEVTDILWRNGKIFRVRGLVTNTEVKGVWIGGHADYMDISKIKLMQYTGFKDKNKKEAYDGDMVVNNNTLNGKSCGVPFLVYWDIHKKGWALWNKKYLNPIWYFSAEEVEIIGNIHENPELLEAHNGDNT